MNKQVPLLLAATLFGVVAGAVIVSKLARDNPSNRQSPTDGAQSFERKLVYEQGEFEPGQIAGTLERLTNTLNEEISERRLLAKQIEQLRSDVEQLRAEHRDSDDKAEVEGRASARARERRFAEVGFTTQDLSVIAPLLAAAQVEASKLDDLARREGWINTSRYDEEMDALWTFESPVRDELGDDGFDRFLYAMGRPNRVVVGGVIPTSQADRAGLQSGDVIVRYGGEPVYSNWHLVRLRSSGNIGETVTVEITRDGQPIQIRMPRGPMGFGGSEENISPITNSRGRSDDSE